MSSLTEPIFLEILNRFENDIDLLRAAVSSSLNDSGSLLEKDTGDKDFKEKLQIANMLNRVVSYTMHINFVTYYKFKKKCQDEGYSIQDGLNALIENYVDGNIEVTKS